MVCINFVHTTHSLTFSIIITYVRLHTRQRRLTLHNVLSARTFHTKRQPPIANPTTPPPANKPAPPPRRSSAAKVAATGTAALAGAIAYDGLTADFQRTGGAVRFARSVRIAATISADYSWSLRHLDRLDAAAQAALTSTVHRRSAERLLAGCLANGGLYIKIGQGVSAINHILPAEYTDTLRRLENECLPRGSAEVRQLFAAEFQRTPEQMFAEFDYTPVAAASLAQVFRARTHAGAEVAVKVQYADLADRFAGDFGTIQLLQAIVKRVHASYNFSWILDELRGNLEQEMDFEHEGRNGERCDAEMAERFGTSVHVPTVHWPLTSRRVLTAEWIDGYKVTDAERMHADGLAVRDVDAKLFDAFAEQIFGTGFVHADPHPGNVLLRRNADGDGRAQIVLLDHGLYEDLPAEVRRPLCEFWEAIVLRDERAMERHAKELGVDGEYNRPVRDLQKGDFRFHFLSCRRRQTRRDPSAATVQHRLRLRIHTARHLVQPVGRGARLHAAHGRPALRPGALDAAPDAQADAVCRAQS